MARTETCEAITLKTYDIGEADRLCIFLSDAHGRIAVRAKGVRKLTSKWGSSVQSFQHLTLDLAEHSSGYYLRSAICINPFPNIRADLRKFSVASRGAELLLHFLHDTEPSPEIFALTQEYFCCCNQDAGALLFPAFQLSLLLHLGLLPSFQQETAFSPELRSYLCAGHSLSVRVKMKLSESDQQSLHALCDELLRDHLSFPMKSMGVAGVA